MPSVRLRLGTLRGRRAASLSARAGTRKNETVEMQAPNGPCPRCGSTSDVRSFRQMVAEAERATADASRTPAEDPPQRPAPTNWLGGDSTLGDDASDSGASPEQAAANIAAAVTADVLRRTVGRRLRRYHQEQYLPAAKARRDEIRRAQLQLAERHPDLCL